MGNSVLDGGNNGCVITKFYTSSAWIEGAAEAQLHHITGWPGVTKIAAFPDLHPGKYGPVGCAVLADRIFPQLIGNDIGCGMSLFQFDLPLRRFKMEKALRRMRMLGEPTVENFSDRLDEIGLAPDLFATALGTIGGGNHFCELQSLAQSEAELGLDKAAVYLLVHSGSRGFGSAVLNALPEGSFAGMTPEAAAEYLRGHDDAVLWARLNRRIIAERVGDALRAELRPLADVPHNLLMRQGNEWLHRKGAAVAGAGLVPLAGSRATASYVLRPTGHPLALDSLAHGAGRRYDRSSMHGRVRGKRSDLEAMLHTPFGGRILCEDRDLLIEEAPLAYKSAQAVVADLAALGAAQPVATFHPLLTFKKTREGGQS